VTYREAEAYLLELELFGMRFGLDRMHRLLTALGLPQHRFAAVHVVGSNGKSSTARMLAALLREGGLRVGTYTSPHLRSFTERIEVDGEAIDADDFAAAVEHAAQAAARVDAAADDPEDRVTQFEALTAAAFHALARRGVELAVVEAGLGGRHDATNVIAARVCALTGVGLEHTRWLGDTLGAIAEEKLAVLGDHAVLVTGELGPEAEEVAERVARERRAHRVRVGAGEDLPGRGPFGRRNLAVALAAAAPFVGTLDPDAVRAAVGDLVLPGRLEEVGRAPLTILDGAHNPAGAHALAEALPEVVEGRPLTLVLSVLDDKDAASMLRALAPHATRLVLTTSHHPRSLAPEVLEGLARAAGAPAAELAPDPRAALERARALAGPEGAVLATGSLYLVADLVGDPSPGTASIL